MHPKQLDTKAQLIYAKGTNHHYFYLSLFSFYFFAYFIIHVFVLFYFWLLRHCIFFGCRCRHSCSLRVISVFSNILGICWFCLFISQLSQDFVWADYVSNICGLPVLLLDLDRSVVRLICIIRFGNYYCNVNQKICFKLFLRSMQLRSMPLSLFVAGLFLVILLSLLHTWKFASSFFFVSCCDSLSCFLSFPCGSVFFFDRVLHFVSFCFISVLMIPPSPYEGLQLALAGFDYIL